MMVLVFGERSLVTSYETRGEMTLTLLFRNGGDRMEVDGVHHQERVARLLASPEVSFIHPGSLQMEIQDPM